MDRCWPLHGLSRLRGAFRFVKVNTDESVDTPMKLGVRGIPTLVFYVDGEEVDRVVGAVPKAALQSKIDAILAEAEDE